MTDLGTRSAAPAWLAAATVREEPQLAYELAVRRPPPEAPRALSVTDLLAPRKAYWRRRRGPAPVPVERELRLEQGRAWHRRLGDLVASEGALEVRLRREGVTARIDLLADVPVEVKTVAGREDGATPEPWPDQVQQLAIYCALAGAGRGRLAQLGLRDPEPPRVAVTELVFPDPAAILAEALHRRDELRTAIERASPGPLPRCPWFEHGCEFRAGGVCDCDGAETEPSTPIEEEPLARTPCPEIAQRWERRLAEGGPPTRRSPDRFRELLHPRRAYYDRTVGRPSVVVPGRPAGAPQDAYEQTVAALEGGPLGEVARLPVGPTAPEEEVLGWRGVPCHVRASRVRTRVGPEELRARFPQYLVDLGYRCAVADRDQGRLLLAHENPAPGEPSVQVFRLELAGGAAAVAESWRNATTALVGAIAEHRPEALEPCPAWMTADCPYRSTCGCAADAGRSQR